MAEVRSEMLRVRVRPGALELIDGRLDGESRSVWLRQLVSWALSSGWRPGQDWKRDYGLQYTPVDGPQVVYDGPQTRMETARAAMASVQTPAASHPAWADEDHDFGDDWEPA